MNKANFTPLPPKNIPYHAEWYSLHFTKHLNQLHLIRSGLQVQGSSHIHELELASRNHLIDAIILVTLKYLDNKYDQETVDKFELKVLLPSRNRLVNTTTIYLKSSFK